MIKREACNRCGRENPVAFSIPDEIWAKVAGETWCDRVLCIVCFDQLASTANVNWVVPELRLYPCTQKAGWQFVPAEGWKA